MKVSVIMPVYNAGAFLSEALASLFNNACHGVDMEIIVIDDCSSDAATLLALAVLDANPLVRVLYQKKNGGPAAARNAGILAAHGDWIAFLDADDIMASGTMEGRRKLVEAHPELRWIAGDMLEIREPNVVRHFQSFSIDKNKSIEVQPGIHRLRHPITELVNWKMLPVLGSMLIHRDLVREIGLFDPSLTFGEDVHFCLVAATITDLYWVERPCLYLRRHHESMTKDLLRLACESPRYTRTLLADSRLRLVRKQLRWQHAAGLRRKAKISLCHKHRWRAFCAAVCSLYWTPNDVNSYRSIIQVFRGMLQK